MILYYHQVFSRCLWSISEIFIYNKVEKFYTLYFNNEYFSRDLHGKQDINEKVISYSILAMGMPPQGRKGKILINNKIQELCQIRIIIDLWQG